MGEPKNPKLKKLLAKPVKTKLKRFTSYKSKVSPKVLQTKSMRGMNITKPTQLGYTKRSLTTASGGAGKDDFRSDPKALVTKEEVRERTLKVKAERKSALEKQKKVPGYVQTKASKKAMGGRMIAREHKIPLSAPFKTVDDQRKVIKNIRANVQIRELHKTLKGTKIDTNYKTPRTMKMTVSNPGAHYSRYNAYDHMSPNWDKKSNTLKLKKVPVSKILKEPNVKEYAQNVKSYVKQKESYEKKIKQEKAAGRLGTKIRQIIKGFNKPKRGK